MPPAREIWAGREEVLTMAEHITGDLVINEVIRRYPQTIKVFNRFHVDACCGGGFSIETTAARDGVDVQALLKALNEVVAEEALAGGRPEGR